MAWSYIFAASRSTSDMDIQSERRLKELSILLSGDCARPLLDTVDICAKRFGEDHILKSGSVLRV